MSTDRPRVLVVEDDPGIGVLQRRRLERAGFDVETAANIDAALEILSATPIAVVILDYRLGDATGLDLHRRMRAGGIDVPVILVSGSMSDATIVDALRAGVRDVVVKTADYLDYLPDAVRGVLSHTAAPLLPSVNQQTCVLIVEDDPGTATLERRQLERAGYKVSVAATADEAIAAVRGGGIGLAVLDLKLPGGASGLELYEKWRGEGIAVPAILVTGFADQATAVRALRLGIRDFVPKSPDFIDYLATAVDRVVAQERVERKLEESERRLASIIGTAMDVIILCDARLHVVLCNRSAEEMFECSAADILGMPVTALFPDLRFDEPGEGGRATQEVHAIRVSNGQRVPVEVSVSDTDAPDGRLLTVIARDITERRRAEAELRDADRRKDEFLGMLAHELRNPLAAIMTAGEVLHRTATDPSSDKLTAVVRRQSRALARMVDDLLDVSRVTLGKIQLAFEPLLLSQVVAKAVDAMRESVAQAGLSITVENDPEPLWLHADGTRLEQVITNLLSNAVKFTPRGGAIRVLTANDGRDAMLTVADTGVGISADLLPRVFDMFVQGDSSLDRSRSGLGIGLALVRKIVMLHGGTVSADSPGPGHGSFFTLRLPLAPQDVRAPSNSPAPAVGDVRRLKVVVVDDQRDVADSVASLIESLGHSVRVAYDGQTAIAVAYEYLPDVMFVDIGMPGMTGYELAERLRRDPALSRTHLVALTGYGSREDHQRVMSAGFDLHRVKPVTDSDLQLTLSTVAASLDARQ